MRDAKVPAGYTWLGYDQGKIPASPLIAAVPFGMEPWEYSAWWYHGGGRELTESIYVRYNLHPIYCGMTGPETAGWFRRRIDSLEDVQGLKIRFAGLEPFQRKISRTFTHLLRESASEARGSSYTAAKNRHTHALGT
mgnify:CR=1 FL=1